MVDFIVASSNIHMCHSTKKKDGSQNKRKAYLGCLDNIWKKYKARFPHPVFPKSTVESFTGALNMKKLELWINTISPVISYLFRCNTDVANLRLGITLKGIILYISDYITKISLKTHAIFDVVQSIFQKNVEILNGPQSRREKTRMLMTKIVNSLTSKLELDTPMIAMYLLGNPNHYTSHKFAPFYWPAFINEVEKVWLTSGSMLIKQYERIVGLFKTYDYIYWAKELESLNLYE